jgi:PhzF family phenazine biosynthesis protein
MKISFYQVDTFTNELFKGNPAAICVLEHWLGEKVLQNIAAENNLSETAFLVQKNQTYDIRWFTPTVEVDLCGHATLGSAFVIFNYLDKSSNKISFNSKSGELIALREKDFITLDFPTILGQPCNAMERIASALDLQPLEVFKGSMDYMAVLESEEGVRQCRPNLNLIKDLDARGLVVTARGEKADFVSRWFGPQVGVKEDPVTGSAHCMLAPYWAKKLNKTKLQAEQLSLRAGKIHCQVNGEHVLLSGEAVLYLQGLITI